MNRFVIIALPDEAKAYDAVKALRELHKEGSVAVYGTAVVQRDADGSLSIKQRDEGAVGLGVGALTGGLIGLLGGPAGAAVGVTAGGVAGGWRDLLHAEVSDEFLEQAQRTLAPGSFGVIAEVSEEWTAPIDARVQALGGSVIRESREVFVDDLLEKRADARKAELADWKSQRAGKKTERMESNLANEIEGARQKLQNGVDPV